MESEKEVIKVNMESEKEVVEVNIEDEKEREKKGQRIFEYRNSYEKYYLAKRRELTQSAITCSKLTKETLEQSVKYVQSCQ